MDMSEFAMFKGAFAGANSLEILSIGSICRLFGKGANSKPYAFFLRDDKSVARSSFTLIMPPDIGWV